MNSLNMSTKVALLAEWIGVCALRIGANKRADVNIEDVRFERTWGFEGGRTKCLAAHIVVDRNRTDWKTNLW